MQNLLLEAAGQPSADLGLQSCYHHSLENPKSRLTHQPGWQQMQNLFAWTCWTPFSWSWTSELSPPNSASPQVHDWPISQDRSKCAMICLKLLDTLQLILDFRAVTTKVLIAPCDNSVTSMAKQCKSSCYHFQSPCCRQLCLLHNSGQIVSIFKSRGLQRQGRIQRAMVCSHKPQEATLKGLLCQNPQVPYFGGLRNWKLLTATAWQSYSNLKHISRTSNVMNGPVLQLSQTAAHFAHLEQTPKTTKDIKIPGIISHCCSSGMPGMPKVGVFRCGESIVGMVHRWARPGPPASVVLAPEKKPETMGLVGESQIFGTGWGCSLRGDGINYRYTTYIQLPLTQHSSN